MQFLEALIFSDVDVNNDNCVDIDEVAKLSGWKPTDPSLVKAFNKADDDG